MLFFIWSITLINLVFLCYHFYGYHVTNYHVNNRKTCLFLFDFFQFKPKASPSIENSNKNNQVVAGKITDQEKLNKLKNNLEKISNIQKRDYNAEDKLKKPKVEIIKDKQTLKTSFNFNKPNEFPNLYKGWLKSEGDQIAKQIILASKNALKSNIKYVEILFDPVPNLDEVAFGTVWNQKFRKDVVSNLQVPEYATNRGGTSTLEWSNIYWANRLAEGLGKKNVLALSLSGEGIPMTDKGIRPILNKSLTLLRFSDCTSNKPKIDLTLQKEKVDLLIILSPCQANHYKEARVLADKLNIPVIALNAPFSHIYDVGGGAPFELAYVMKRVPKGWIYRQFPKDFEVIVEGPNYDVSLYFYFLKYYFII